jgi:diguanylate cyclase (GGDEF)-like protein
MMSVASFLEKRSKSFWIITGLAFIIILGAIDFRTGYEVSFSLFYLIPIFLAVWFTNGWAGLGFSFASTITWFVADYSAGMSYSHPSIYLWNAFLRLSFYCVVTWLGSNLKKTYKANLELVRVDYVTGATSIRHFYDLAQLEMQRFKRHHHPLALAYFDLDDFKAVNDRLGHSTGDRVLRAVTDIIRKDIRPCDTFARLGGDEFALLMPETGEAAARSAINDLHAALVTEMLRNSWMVSFSIGIVICNDIPKTVDDLVKLADDTMYSVKNDNKNGFNLFIYNG